jgi:hypothetical protein
LEDPTAHGRACVDSWAQINTLRGQRLRASAVLGAHMAIGIKSKSARAGDFKQPCVCNLYAGARACVYSVGLTTAAAAAASTANNTPSEP